MHKPCKKNAKEEDIKTVMDMLPIDSDNVKNLLFTVRKIIALKAQTTFFTSQGSNFEAQERHNNAMLTRRIPKPARKCSGKLQDRRQADTIENIVRNTSTNNDDELAKRATTITEEHLSNLVPVIADLMSFVSTKVKLQFHPGSLVCRKRDSVHSLILTIRLYCKHCKFM